MRKNNKDMHKNGLTVHITGFIMHTLYLADVKLTMFKKYLHIFKRRNNMKKFLAIILALAMILSFAACGEKKEAQPAAAEAGVKTVQAGKLIMGTNAAFPPYEFISDEDGETIVGIDAEIAGLVAEELGLELVIEDMEFSSIISAVQTGKIDIGLAGMTVTEERLKNVNFSSTYAQGVQVVIVPKENSKVASLDDLSSAKIGVQESTTGHIYCEGEFGADAIVAYSTGVFAVQALLNGDVDCVVIDNEPAKAFVAANEELTILDSEYAVEDYAAAISKDNPDLLEQFNKVLDEKISDGTVKQILDKYINAN